MQGLLKSAIRDENPVMFFADIGLLCAAGEVPDSDHVVPIGKASVRREWSDVTRCAKPGGRWWCTKRRVRAASARKSR